MKKHLLTTLLLLGPVMVLAAPSTSAAQQPKLDIKIFVGVSATTLVARLESGRERETSPGIQFGFGPRLRRRKWFVESLFSFNRWAFSFTDPTIGRLDGVAHAFEFPINAGYIPYKNPYFKLFLYAGYVNHFNLKLLLDADGGATLRLRPKEANFAIYQALARFGVNIDLAMFNLDFNYSISLNSVTSTSFRTSYQQVQFNLAYVF